MAHLKEKRLTWCGDLRYAFRMGLIYETIKAMVFRNSRIFIFAAALVFSLAACHGDESITKPRLSEPLGSATLIEGTGVPDWESTLVLPTPSLAPVDWLTATINPGKNPVKTPKPDQRVYVDPEGWYAVNFPAYLEPTERENYFAKDNRFMETGYLPELGSMSNVRNVCAWLANIVEGTPENFVHDWTHTSANCAFQTRPGILRQIKYEIYENPGADEAHRFVYVKTGWLSPNEVPGCSFRADFSWLKPIDENRPVSRLTDMDAEEIDEWAATAPFLNNVTLHEYALPPGSNPYKEMLISTLPEEALPDWARKDDSRAETENLETAPAAGVTLETLGYELKSEITQIKSGPYLRKQLYRDGRLLFDYVFDVSEVYSFSTEEGPLTVFVVTTRGLNREQNSFLILNDAILGWRSSHQDPPFGPVLYQGELLWLKANEGWHGVDVVKSNGDVVFSFFVAGEPMYSTKNFLVWNDHWIWATRNFLVQDGEILNGKLGFQEIFEWRLVENKPAYLFRKDGRVGFSYDGKILPLAYQNVARDLCCGYAVNNPWIGDTRAHFFAEREGVWYYVVLKFR